MYAAMCVSWETDSLDQLWIRCLCVCVCVCVCETVSGGESPWEWTDVLVCEVEDKRMFPVTHCVYVCVCVCVVQYCK